MRLDSRFSSCRSEGVVGGTAVMGRSPGAVVGRSPDRTTIPTAGLHLAAQLGMEVQMMGRSGDLSITHMFRVCNASDSTG